MRCIFSLRLLRVKKNERLALEHATHSFKAFDAYPAHQIRILPGPIAGIPS
jgi:hypothetical protein